jgi:hypothetical protein
LHEAEQCQIWRRVARREHSPEDDFVQDLRYDSEKDEETEKKLAARIHTSLWHEDTVDATCSSKCGSTRLHANRGTSRLYKLTIDTANVAIMALPGLRFQRRIPSK